MDTLIEIEKIFQRDGKKMEAGKFPPIIMFIVMGFVFFFSILVAFQMFWYMFYGFQIMFAGSFIIGFLTFLAVDSLFGALVVAFFGNKKESKDFQSSV